MILLALFAGCGDKSLELKIRFEAIHGLVSGAPVWFESNAVGSVSKVEFTPEGDYLVHVNIAQEFAAAATEYTRFFIIPDPKTPTTSAVEVIQTQKGGRPLQDGATIPGATKTSAHLDRLMDQLAEGIEDAQRRWTTVIEDLHALPESEAYRSLDAELDRLDKEVSRSTEKARKELHENVLPKIEQAVRLLKERLGQAGRESETEPLERKLKALQEDTQ
jgi:hypothetical protein